MAPITRRRQSVWLVHPAMWFWVVSLTALAASLTALALTMFLALGEQQTTSEGIKIQDIKNCSAVVTGNHNQVEIHCEVIINNQVVIVQLPVVNTPTPSPSITATITITPAGSPSPEVAPTLTATPNASPTTPAIPPTATILALPPITTPSPSTTTTDISELPPPSPSPTMSIIATDAGVRVQPSPTPSPPTVTAITVPNTTATATSSNATPSPIYTNTATSTPITTPTFTPTRTSTATPRVTMTTTATVTSTPTHTATPTPTYTATPTPTNTPAPTPTPTASPRSNIETGVLACVDSEVPITTLSGKVMNYKGLTTVSQLFTVRNELRAELWAITVEGYPDECQTGGSRCGQNQRSESYRVYIDDVEVGGHNDQGPEDKKYFEQPWLVPFILTPGEHRITVEHTRQGDDIGSVDFDIIACAIPALRSATDPVASPTNTIPPINEPTETSTATASPTETSTATKAPTAITTTETATPTSSTTNP